MFTGIVKDIGRIETLQRCGSVTQLFIRCRLAGERLEPGESVAVSGVCLTVESFNDNGFSASVSPETMRRTVLGRIRTGREVNLERALRLADRLGGHLVQGHVDAVGKIRDVAPSESSRVLSIQAPDSVVPYLVECGSITVDGVSLTVTGVEGPNFTVTLIPATLEATTLSRLNPGDEVNLEADVIGKYVAHLLAARQEGSLKEAAMSSWLGAAGED